MDFTKPHKPPRLPNHDYSSPGYYFVTFNTRLRNRDILGTILPGSDDTVGTPTTGPDDTVGIPAPVLDDIVGAAALGGPAPVHIQLTPAGQIVDELIRNIHRAYPDVHVDCYVIMPDHVHLIVVLGCQDGPPKAAAPTSLSQVINSLKGLSRKRYGTPLWQDEYYDHIIRNDADLSDTRKYITGSPIKKEESP